MQEGGSAKLCSKCTAEEMLDESIAQLDAKKAKEKQKKAKKAAQEKGYADGGRDIPNAALGKRMCGSDGGYDAETPPRGGES